MRYKFWTIDRSAALEQELKKEEEIHNLVRENGVKKVFLDGKLTSFTYQSVETQMMFVLFEAKEKVHATIKLYDAENLLVGND